MSTSAPAAAPSAVNTPQEPGYFKNFGSNLWNGLKETTLGTAHEIMRTLAFGVKENEKGQLRPDFSESMWTPLAQATANLVVRPFMAPIEALHHGGEWGWHGGEGWLQLSRGATHATQGIWSSTWRRITGGIDRSGERMIRGLGMILDAPAGKPIGHSISGGDWMVPDCSGSVGAPFGYPETQAA
jgi:hypothetical protein